MKSSAPGSLRFIPSNPLTAMYPAGVLSIALASATPIQSQEYLVQGRVLERANLQPVPRAAVRIDGGYAPLAFTDTAGRFQIRLHPSALRARAPGSAPDRLRRIISSFYSKGIWIAADGRIQALRANHAGTAGGANPGPEGSAKSTAGTAGAHILDISMPGLVTKTFLLEDVPRNLGDIVLDYSPRKLDVGAPPIYGSVVLFDGTRASLDTNWQMWMGNYRRKNGLGPTPITWEHLKDPVDTGMTMRTCCRVQWGDEDLVTKRKFKDFQLHVEFNLVSPPRVGGGNPGPANSGIYLQSLYEIQIKDDFGKAVLGDHDEGAILNEFAAPKNEGRPRGAWQAYDITYRAARFTGGTRSEKARLTLFWNGKLVHEDKQTANEHAVGISSDSLTEAPRGLKLQNEGHDVRFRNVWIKELDLKTPDTRAGY